MADYLELLNQAANKQTEVAAAAQQKKAELAANATAMPTAADFYQIAAGMGNERGALSMGEMETDLRTLNPSQLYAKYGEQASELISGRAQGGYALMNDQATPDRSAGELLGDTLSGAGMGFANAFAGIGALGVGLVDAESGEQISQGIQQANEFVRESQSSQLNSARRAEEAGAALNRRDTAAQFEQDRQMDGDVLASLKRMGRDLINTLDTATDSSATFGQGTADAVGSLLAGGPIASGIRKAGIGALSQLGKAGVVGLETGARLHSAGGRLAMPAAIAAMESGGAFQGTAAEVAGMKPEQLEQNSPYYNELIAQGLTPEQARAEVGNRAGLMAAAIQAPIAAATGALVSRFEANPLSAPSARAALNNALLREPLEEAIQSGSGQMAQNAGIQQSANQSRTLSEGVGEQAALGGLFGLTSGGVVQGPAAVSNLGEAGVSALSNFIDQRVTSVQQANESSAPDSVENIAAQTEQAVAGLPEAEQVIQQAVETAQATPEQKTAANAYATSLLGSLRFDQSELEQEGVPDVLRQVLSGSPHRIENVERLVQAINDLPENDPNEIALGFGLYVQLEPMREMLQQDASVLDVLPEDHMARTVTQHYGNLLASLQESPRVQGALRQVEQRLGLAAENDSIQPVTEESLQTPEGQENAQKAIAVATVVPHKGKPEVVEALLEQADRGNLNLTQPQRASLMTSITLLRAAQTYDQEAERVGLSPMDIVAKQIKTDTSKASGNALSAWQHAQSVVEAKRAGNDSLAAERLVDFGRFVQHMQNKVGALNSHFQGGDSKAPAVKYQALRMDATRGWKESTEGMKVHPTSVGSLKFAQSVALEAKTLADVFNGLSAAFPELNAGTVAPLALDSRLDGNVNEVAERFKNPQVASNQGEEVLAPQAVAEEVNDLMPWGEDDLNNVGDQVTPTEELQPEERGQAPAEEDPAVQSRVSVEQARRLSDAGLNDRLNNLMDKRIAGTATVEDQATFEVLNGEMTRREDEAYAEMQQQEAEEEQAQKEEILPQSPVQSEVSTEPVEKKEPGEGIDFVFPNLFGSSEGKNFFKKAFTLPKEASTRTIGSGAPLQYVREALSSSTSLSHLLGSKLRHSFDKELAGNYEGYLDFAESLKETLHDNLQSFLKSDGLEEKFLKGTPVNRYMRGKPLNLVEQTGNGFAYNQELIEGAVLAGLQWLLTAEDMSTRLEEEDLAKLLGVEEAYLQPGDLEAMNEGLYTTQAIRSLASKIRSFWGVSTNTAVSKSYTEGIPESLAAEVLRALIANDLIEVKTVEFGAAHGLKSTRTFNRYISKLEKDINLRQFPSAIEQVVLLEPEEITYIGPVDDSLPVAEKQMNNPVVSNTLEQKEALENEQKTVFRLNRPMAGFYTALGERNIVRLFGGGDLEGKPFNINHAKTVDGRNRTLISGFQALRGTLQEMTNVAEANGLDLGQVPVRYTYNFSRVGRMQMLGKHNPQASKLVREALLPTWTTLDLASENSSHFGAFGLGLAQALGIKVHGEMPEAITDKLTKLLTETLAPSVSLVQNWLSAADLTNPLDMLQEIGDGDIQTLQDNFKAAGEAVTPVAVHALMEYARYQLADTEQRKAFETALYLEADGVTNGPVNAMALMSIGAFGSAQLRNIAKGGLFVGQVKSMNEHRTKDDNEDLYQASTTAFSQYMINLRERHANEPKVTAQIDRLLNVMDLFFGNDLNFDESTGELTVKRGLAKNPLTITVYGSGAAGIASKMTKILMDKIYERMSTALQINAADPSIDLVQAMFPGDLTAQEKWDTFTDSLERLIGASPRKAKGGFVFYMKPTLTNSNLTYDFSQFTLNPEQFRAIRDNMLALFVGPMRNGIGDTMGLGLMTGVEILRKGVQVQSIFLQDAFQQELLKTMGEKQLDPEWRKGDFLSEKELNQILKRLTPLSPLISVPGQKFFIAGSESTDISVSSYGRALDDTLESPPYVYGPTDAGVAGIPFLTIGMGDGKMMQLLSQDGDVTDTLKIFDGMNMPLDKINEYSEKANKAVYDSWKGNPLRAVLDSWVKFRPHATLNGASQETLSALTKALFPPFMWETVATPKQIFAEMGRLGNELDQAARSIDARHQALQSVQVSVDQMAAAASPYISKGEVLPEGTTDEEVLDLLNERYFEALKESHPSTEVKDPVIKKSGKLDRQSGVRLLDYQTLKRLAKDDGLTSVQRSLFNDIIRSLGAKEYTVVFGSLGQIARFQKLNGYRQVGIGNNGTVRGITSVGERMVYLFDPSLETLVHELIHVSTYESVLDYYNGRPLSAEVKAAVRRIEVLKEQFLSTEWDGLNTKEQQAFDDAVSAINQQESNLNASEAENKAGGLNEFMAWALANQQLADRLAAKRAHPLARMARDVVTFLKKLIWGERPAPKVFEDMLSTLRFNAGVVIHSQPVAGALINDATLYQSSSYGNNARLTGIRQTFARKIGQYLKSRPNTAAPLVKAQAGTLLADAIDLARSIQGRGFSMSKQEQTTFQMIVAALATEARINPVSLVQAQQLFARVLKELTVEHFMADPDSLDPVARYYAQEQYDAVVGKGLVQVDAQGRSSMLPVFLGLAMVNDQFREVLSRIALPKRSKATGGGLDVALESLGHAAMDKLSARLSGTGQSDMVQEALDKLMEQILDTAQDEQTFLDQVADTVGGVMDRANGLVLDGIERVSNTTLEAADKVLARSNNKVVQTAANLAKLMAGIATEDNGQRVAQGLMADLNRTKVWKPLHDLINDLVGRTTSNAGVYDLIKATRSHVQQARQQFREVVPSIIMGKFTRKLSNDEWSSLYRSMGKTDLAALTGRFSKTEVLELASDAQARRKAIRTLENELKAVNPNAWPVYQLKIEQLAQYLNTGLAGNNLLRNAYAVANLFGEQRGLNWTVPDAAFVRTVDQLVTLRALDSLNQGDKDTLSSLVQREAEGLSFTLSYLNGQRAEEQRKAQTSGMALANHYKGYLPSLAQPGVSLQVAETKEYRKLRERSFVPVAGYVGSSLDQFARGKDYYFAPVSGRAAFNQGIAQNVRQTVSGVDATYGYTTGHMTAGIIHDPRAVQRIRQELRRERPTREPLLPLYDETGAVVAFERSIDPAQLAKLNPDTHLAKMIGVWRGRQMEEVESQFFNEKLVDSLQAMYQADLISSKGNQDQYVNLYDEQLLKNDPVLADAVNLFSPEIQEYIRQQFGNEFWVRKDMVTDVVGHRMASVGDAWTGTTRWSKNAQDSVKRLAISVWGNEAYRKLVNGEQILQNYVGDAKTMIVVKSVVVPFGNLVSNIFQLMARGTPLVNIARGLPKKTMETHAYIRSRLRQIEVEAELRAAEGDPVKTRKLQVELQSIVDGHKRLSIWPLIEAGEFSSIADVGMTHEDLELASGRLNDYIEKQVDRLPKGIRTVGRYALVTRDTALFQGLQKAVQYSDFLAKAMLFDDLTERKGLTSAQALARITEEFVNYDRLSGRFRNYLESVGLLWFYNFKIRSTKVALSMIRNNPLHTLLAANNPIGGMLSGGLPVDDNLLAKLFDGSLDYSIGPGQGIEAPLMNPWVNLAF